MNQWLNTTQTPSQQSINWSNYEVVQYQSNQSINRPLTGKRCRWHRLLIIQTAVHPRISTHCPCIADARSCCRTLPAGLHVRWVRWFCGYLSGDSWCVALTPSAAHRTRWRSSSASPCWNQGMQIFILNSLHKKGDWMLIFSTFKQREMAAGSSSVRFFSYASRMRCAKYSLSVNWRLFPYRRRFLYSCNAEILEDMIKKTEIKWFIWKMKLVEQYTRNWNYQSLINQSINQTSLTRNTKYEYVPLWVVE